MGLMDMFKKKDAAKETYREEVKKAVSDGKLTADKMQRLEDLKKELDVTAASQDMTMVRREQYQAAADAVKATGGRSGARRSRVVRLNAMCATPRTAARSRCPACAGCAGRSARPRPG